MASVGFEDDVPELLSDSENERGTKNSSGAEAAACESDKQWKDLDDDEIDEDDEEDIYEDEEDEMMNVLTGDVKCLFSDYVATSVDVLLAHMTKEFGFNLIDICKKWSVDCIDYIKMINYIRRQKPKPEDVIKYFTFGQEAPWNGDEHMVAFDPEDLLLQFDIEGAERRPRSRQTSGSASTSHQTPPQTHFGVGLQGTGDGATEADAVRALVERVQAAERQRDLLKEELERSLQDIERLRIAGQQLVMDSSSRSSSKLKKSGSNDDSLPDEDGYFASYSHHDIHMTMLKDKVRTESYRDFMYKNPHLFQGKTVLDVGCGTGILSMFAAKAGASHVVAVDQSNIIYQAMDIARENGLHERITFVKGRLEDVNLPIEEFDLIISEWMGYFLLFEAMLDSVLWAKSRYLKPDGCVYPDHFSMLVVGVSDPDLRNAKLEFWDDVYGFKMSCMKSMVSDEVHVRLVKPDTVITEPAVIKDLDVMNCKVSDLDFAAEFSLQCLRNAEITALVGYFDTNFLRGCENPVSFSTGPKATPTHWEQAVMMLPTPVPVKADACIPCKVSYRKHPRDTRGIIITLAIDKHRLKYSLS